MKRTKNALLHLHPKKISVHGCGHVGLVAGLCFAQTGHSVLGFDVNSELVKNLNHGVTHFYEKGLRTLLKDEIKQKNIVFTDDVKQAVKFSNIHFIAVATPPHANGSADHTHLFHAVTNIAKHVEESFLLIIISTVPPGTAQKVEKKIKEILKKRNRLLEFEVVLKPEFLVQGNSIECLRMPSRIVIGASSKKAFQTVKELYRPIIQKRSTPTLHVSPDTAALIKYTSNAYLATKISFINLISLIAEKFDIDIDDVIKGVEYDPRIGFIAHPGIGFGGSCLTKDFECLSHLAGKNFPYRSFLKAVLEVNKGQRKLLFKKIVSFFNGEELANKTIAVWGLAYKQGTEDLRDAPSMEIIDLLLASNAIVQVYDPAANANFRRIHTNKPNLKVMDSKEAALNHADALVILTEWEEFSHADPHLFKKLKEKVIFDGRNIYNKKKMKEAGIHYLRIG